MLYQNVLKTMQIRAFYDYKLLSDAVDGIVLSSETGTQYRNNEVVFTAGMCYIKDGTGHLCKCTCRDAGYILSHTGFTGQSEQLSCGVPSLRRRDFFAVSRLLPYK
jgi:hypothetical protein